MYIQDENGNKKELLLSPSGDTLPMGSEVNFDGNVVPTGWEKVEEENIVTNGEPVKTGRKVDGKWEYVIKLAINSLPNNALKDYNINLPNNIKIIKMENTIYFPNGDTSTMPYSYKEYTDIQTPAYRKETNSLRIVTASDRSSVSAEIYFYFIYEEV